MKAKWTEIRKHLFIIGYELPACLLATYCPIKLCLHWNCRVLHLVRIWYQAQISICLLVSGGVGIASLSVSCTRTLAETIKIETEKALYQILTKIQTIFKIILVSWIQITAIPPLIPPPHTRAQTHTHTPENILLDVCLYVLVYCRVHAFSLKFHNILRPRGLDQFLKSVTELNIRTYIRTRREYAWIRILWK
jgi:hypothetical protein